MVKRFFFRTFCGLFLGISVFAPGFSGSIIAIILGIYQDILRIISNPFKRFKENIKFCIPIGIGVAASAVLFILTFSFLFDTYEKATYLLFVGLVAGNLPVIYSEIKKCEFKKRYLIGAVVAFVAALALGVVATGTESMGSGDTENISLLLLAGSGLAGGVTALIPGMSISVVLIIAGVYYPLLSIADSFLHLEFVYVVPFGVFCLGFLVGLVSVSSLIKYIFKKYPGFANAMVFGFMSGSLLSVLYNSLRIEDADFNWFIGSVMLIAGLVISMLFVVLGKKMQQGDDSQQGDGSSA